MHIPATVLGAGDIAVNKDTAPHLQGVYIQVMGDRQLSK
jgi:hypothetical protein